MKKTNSFIYISKIVTLLTLPLITACTIVPTVFRIITLLILTGLIIIPKLKSV